MIVKEATGLPFVPGEQIVTQRGSSATYVGCNAREVFIQIGPRVHARPLSDIGAVRVRSNNQGE